MNFNLEKIKESVYLLTFYNLEKPVYKILKIAVKKETKFYEYNIYKTLLEKCINYNVENFKDYYLFNEININSKLKLKFDEDTIIITTLNIIEEYMTYDTDHNLKEKINISILSGNYYPKNKIFDSIIKYINNEELINMINRILINLTNARTQTNFKHCDFKINNILIREDNTPSLFDFDFSLFLGDKEKIEIQNSSTPKVNLYLQLPKGTKINGLFLKLFDIYLFTLSFIYSYNLHKINELLMIKNLLDYKLSNEKLCVDYCSDFYIFWLIYSRLLLNLPSFFTETIYFDFAKFKTIKIILSDIRKINKNNQELDNLIKNHKIIEGFIFIEAVFLSS